MPAAPPTARPAPCTVLRGVDTADIGTALATNLTNGDYDDEVVYSYDQTGNRTTLEVTPQGGSTTTTAYAHNEVNEMTTEDGATLTYDANGAYTDSSADSNGFAYNHADQLAEYDDGTVEWTFHFDGLGRRIQRDNSSTGRSIRFYYDGIHCVDQVNEISNNETNTKSFVYGSGVDELLEYVDRAPSPDAAYYVHADRLGSVMLLVDTNGAIEESYRYEEFGSTVIVDGAFAEVTVDPHDSPVGNPYRYTGRRQDIMIQQGVADDDWYYSRARNLRTEVGRFVQRVAASQTGSVGPVYDAFRFFFCVQNPNHPICQLSNNGGEDEVPGNKCPDMPVPESWYCRNMHNEGCKVTIFVKDKFSPEKCTNEDGVEGTLVDVVITVECGDPEDPPTTKCKKPFKNICSTSADQVGPISCGGDTMTIDLEPGKTWGKYGTGLKKDCYDDLNVSCQ